MHDLMAGPMQSYLSTVKCSRVSPARSSSTRILCHGVVGLSPATLVEAELF